MASRFPQVAAIGPNGAGKTTLLGTINGILQYTSGEATVFGKEVKKFGRSLRKEIGYVFQEFEFDDFTPFLTKK
jgi:ABC-2 type transport system ATP-binding protein